MKKKEFLIILILAFLITWLSQFFPSIRSLCPLVTELRRGGGFDPMFNGKPGSLEPEMTEEETSGFAFCYGFPLNFAVKFHDGMLTPRGCGMFIMTFNFGSFYPLGFLIDFLFWILVLLIGWWVFKKFKRLKK